MSQNRAWTWRHAIIKSDLPATTRHVLLTISCFMNDVGGGCYPTQEQLAEATGLTDRAVRKHIEIAEASGWLIRKEHGFRGQKWRNHEYEARWPGILDVDEGAERGSSRLSEGAERGSGKVRNEVPTTNPRNNIPLNPQNTGKENPNQYLGSVSARFDALAKAWARTKVGDRTRALNLFEGLTVREQMQAVENAALAVTAYTRRKSRVPVLASFLRDRMFVEFVDAPDIDLDGHFRITPNRPEWTPWLTAIRRRYGEKAVERIVEGGFYLTQSRWPED